MNINNYFSALNFMYMRMRVCAGTSRAETHVISGAYICNCMHCKDDFFLATHNKGIGGTTPRPLLFLFRFSDQFLAVKVAS